MRRLPEDLLCHISSFLDVPFLLRMRLLNHGYRMLMSRNEAGWTAHCQRLWRDKQFVPQQARTHAHAMSAYQISLEDAQHRHDITMQELCYIVSEQQGTIWSFRFKESAGDDWTGVDPWYHGQEERQMVFLTDNTVKQYIAYTSQEYKNLTIPIFAQLNKGVLVDPFGNLVTWRWVSQPMDLPTRQATGSYLRLQVGGRDVPTYVVRRSPTNNWGFIMESCWGLYASFPLPPRPTHSHLRLRHVPPNEVRLVPVSDDEDEHEHHGIHDSQQQALLVDDSALVITNQVQWREALLYNFGVDTLPEGTEAAQVFDDTWGEALSEAFP